MDKETKKKIENYNESFKNITKEATSIFKDAVSDVLLRKDSDISSDILISKKQLKEYETNTQIWMVEGVCIGLLGAMGLFAGAAIGVAPWTLGSSIIVIIGICLFIIGRKKTEEKNRIIIYCNELQAQQEYKIDDLAKRVGVDNTVVQNEINLAISKKIFPQAHFNEDKSIVFLSHKAYQVYLSRKTEMEKTNKQGTKNHVKNIDSLPETVVKRLNKGSEYISKIVSINNSIEDEKISSEVLDTITNLEKIFLFIRNHPEDIEDTNHLFKYYLPTTIKFLETYAEMESGNVDGKNINKSKEEIEKTLISLNQGYKVMLDDMYQNTSIDITADASVIEKLLEQQGLNKEKVK